MYVNAEQRWQCWTAFNWHDAEDTDVICVRISHITVWWCFVAAIYILPDANIK